MSVEIHVAGRRVYTTEQLAELLHKTPSAVRSIVKRHGITPAGYVTRNVPVYDAADLGIPSDDRR